MHHLLTSAAKEDNIEGFPEPMDLAGESSAACIFTDCYITTDSAGTGWVWGRRCHHPLAPLWRKVRQAQAQGCIKRGMTMLPIQWDASPTVSSS